MNARIKDVAKKAGVSVATVSRVLNGGKCVSDKLKESVMSAIEELNYSPSYIARSLVTKKTNIIGVIVPDLTSSFFSTILSSIEENASANNYNIMVCNIAENLDKEYKYLNLFKQIRADAVIIMHEKTDDRIIKFVSGLPMPVIFCSCKAFGINNLSIIIL
jgi:LacI family transcriptional regulator